MSTHINPSVYVRGLKINDKNSKLELQHSGHNSDAVLVWRWSLIEVLFYLIAGVAYITDKNRGNCSYRKIESGDFDDRSTGPNTVRIRNTREFFYFDVDKTTTSYEGVVRF